jgi:23S rRNA pseudoU1915 N3-methylase RlmH
MTIQQWLEQNVVKSFQEYEERMRDGEFVDDAELVEEVRKLFLSQTKEEVKEVSVTEVSEEISTNEQTSFLDPAAANSEELTPSETKSSKKRSNKNTSTE